MPAGKLTVQAWHEAQEREAMRDQIAREITRDIVRMAFAMTRRRKPSLLRRFVRAVSF